MLSQTGEGRSIVELYRTILQREGVLGLWAGNGANLVRIFPAKAVVFSANDVYRTQLMRLLPSNNQANKDRWSGPAGFMAGGLAGMTATLVTYPLDLARGRISGKMASQSGHKTYGGILRTVALTVKDEGFLALYKGVTPTLLGAMPYEGIKFGTVGLLEALFPRKENTMDDSTSTLSPATRKMLFGGTGGVMAGLITYPNDTIRRLLQLQGSRGSGHLQYAGYWDCLKQTVRTGGIRRLYAGLTINLIRMAPNTAVQFGSYEVLKRWSEQWL